MIVLWTVFVGAVYTTVTELSLMAIKDSSEVIGSAVDGILTLHVSIFYASFALVAMLCPLIGFIC